MGNDEFKCGDRCFFYIAAGIGNFGTVVSIDETGVIKLIDSDGRIYYTADGKNLIKIGER